MCGMKTVLEVKRSDMNLVLVRHGETQANLAQRWSGSRDLEITDLTDRGKEQAIRLGRWFKERRFVPNHVYSSPQRRAFETAILAGGHWGLNVEKIEDLKETGAGMFEGLNWSEIEERYPREAEGFRDSRDWSVVRGAEQESDRRRRGERLLKLALSGREPDDVVVMFCHGGIIQHTVSVIFQSPKLWGIPVKNTALFEFRIDIKRWASETRERFNPTLWQILRFNDVPHLKN